MQKVGEIKAAHDERILGSAVSPDGCTVVTGASDENLKVGVIASFVFPHLAYAARSPVLEIVGGEDGTQEGCSRQG